MKKYLSIILITFIILFPLKVGASEIYLNCDSEVIKSNTISCTLTGKTNGCVTAISIKINNTNSNIFSFKKDDKWQGGINEDNISLYTADALKENFNIGTIIFNITNLDKNNITINLSDIFIYDGNYEEEAINNISKTIPIANNDNNLSSLTISNGTLSPSFISNITTYNATVDKDSITISAKVSNSKSSITGDIGTRNLNYGNNNFRIVVTSEMGNSKIYNISINRPDNSSNNSNNDKKEAKKTDNNNDNKINISNNTYLKSITLSTGNIDFKKKTTNYSMNVSYDINDIEIEALPEDSKSKVEITGNKDLKVGSNEIKIKVIAENNDIKEYIINVDKKDKDYILSSNNNISKITIKNYNLDFKKDKLEYNLIIKNEDKLDISIKLEDSKSKYKVIGNKNLKNNSIIKIKVIAEDNNIKTYSINIKKNRSTNNIIVFISIIVMLICINIIRVVLKRRSKCYERIYKKILKSKK